MRVFAEPWYDGISMYQKTTDNFILAGLRTKFVLIGKPSLSVFIRIKNSKGTTIADTTTKTIAPTQDYLYMDTYFSLTPFQTYVDETYTFELKVTGTQTSTSYIAWVTDYPYLVYSGFTPSAVNVGVCPYSLTFIGADL